MADTDRVLIGTHSTLQKLSICRKTLFQIIKEGRLTPIRLNKKKWLFVESEVESLIENSRMNNTGESI